METKKSLPCPLHIGWALAKFYDDLFYTPNSLPYFLQNFLLTARLLARFSSDSKARLLTKLFS